MGNVFLNTGGCTMPKLLLTAFFIGASYSITPAYAQNEPLQTRFELSIQECREAGDFIKNAALSRDNGITREFFIQKIEDDLIVIKSYPAEMRWFAKDDYREGLLLGAAKRVFDEPTSAIRHQIMFIDSCMQSPDWRLRT